MRTTAINEQQVHQFLSSLVEEELHAKRVLSLALATLGVIHAASLSVYAIGQALGMARGTTGKHGVKQVDRLLSNSGVDVWKLFALWVPYLLAQRSEAVVSLDWTDFDADDHSTLVASLRIGGIEAMWRVRAGAEVPRSAADGGRASSEPSGWRSRAAA